MIPGQLTLTVDPHEFAAYTRLVADLAVAKSFEFTELRARAQELTRPPRPAAGDEPLVRPTGSSPEPTQEH